MKNHLAFACAIALIAIACSTQSYAGPAPAPIAPPPAAMTPEESPWEFDILLYGWLANLKGDVGVAGTLSSIDVGFGDILDNLNMVASGTISVQNGKFGIFADFMYIEIAPSFETPGPLNSRTDLTLGQTMVDLKGTYQIAEWDKGWLNLQAGARYMNMDLDITLQPGLAPRRHVSGNDGWWDAVGGIRAQHYLTDRAFLLCMADVGGGSSDLTWQVLAGIGYQINEHTDLRFVYRYMDYDYSSGGFTYDVATQGLGIGLGLSF